VFAWAIAVLALSASLPLSHNVRQTSVGPYTILVRSDSIGTEDVCEVRRDGEAIFVIDDYIRISIDKPLQEDGPVLTPGTDVSGDGIPDAVVYGWSGGAHCCFTSWILSLGDEFRILAEVHGGHSEAIVEDMDEDDALEVVVRDWSFAYFPYSFGGSPAPIVVLDWAGSRLEPSPVLTGFPRPDEQELAAEALSLRQSSRWEGDEAGRPYSEVFGRVLDLLYAGYEDLAWSYLEQAWGGDPATKIRLVAALGRRLEQSPYYSRLERARGHRQ
jgi:hypothetical protein